MDTSMINETNFRSWFTSLPGNYMFSDKPRISESCPMAKFAKTMIPGQWGAARRSCLLKSEELPIRIEADWIGIVIESYDSLSMGKPLSASYLRQHRPDVFPPKA